VSEHHAISPAALLTAFSISAESASNELIDAAENIAA
jgi:hypothetical protein